MRALLLLPLLLPPRRRIPRARCPRPRALSRRHYRRRTPALSSSLPPPFARFWDYSTGYSFQEAQSAAQPGSLDSEAGIYALSFDMSGSRLISCEADKTIKIYREDDAADETTHPLDMEAWTEYCRALRKY